MISPCSQLTYDPSPAFLDLRSTFPCSLPPEILRAGSLAVACTFDEVTRTAKIVRTVALQGGLTMHVVDAVSLSVGFLSMEVASTRAVV